jgi:hypothetical protein
VAPSHTRAGFMTNYGSGSAMMHLPPIDHAVFNPSRTFTVVLNTIMCVLSTSRAVLILCTMVWAALSNANQPPSLLLGDQHALPPK